MVPGSPTERPEAGRTSSSGQPRARRRWLSKAWTFCSGGGGKWSVACSVSFLAIVVILAMLSVLSSLGQVTTLRSRGESVEHTYQVLLSAANVQRLLNDAETGQRGFLLTGDVSYLAPYHLSLPALEAETRNLEALAAEIPDQAPRVQKIRDLIALKLRELERTVDIMRQAGPQEAVAIVAAGEGRAAMDLLRNELDAIVREEQRWLAAREARIPIADRSLRSLLITRAALLITFLVAAWLLNIAVMRRRAELARSRDLLATTLSSIGDGVIVTDPRGRVTFLNAEAERLTGWKSAEAAGRPLPEVFRIVNETTRLPVESPVDKVIRLGTVVGLANHTILIAKDGVETSIDDSAAPIRAVDCDEPMSGVVLVFRDFTQHKVMERQLLDHQKTLEIRVAERTAELESAHHRLRLADRMAAVGTLASGLAHDMKNVLLPLTLRLDAAQGSPGLTDEVRGDLAGIMALIEHLREMARNLSLFARDPEQEGTEGRSELAAWSSRVRGFIDVSVLENPRDRGRKLSIEWRIPHGLPPVRVATHRLTQAVLNLVHNSRDAILSTRPADGAEPGRIIVTAELEPSGDAVAVRVSDNGCGMDEDTQRRATELFFTTKDRDTTPGLVGSGLGLSLASAIAERCGGRLEIKSAVGAGTVVSLVLPIAPPETTALPGSAVTAATPAAALPSTGLARVDIEDVRRRAVVVGILRTLRYDIAASPIESRDPAESLWITDASAADPTRAESFLKAGPGRRVIALGGGPDWQRAGAVTLDASLPVSKLRDVLSEIKA